MFYCEFSGFCGRSHILSQKCDSHSDFEINLFYRSDHLDSLMSSLMRRAIGKGPHNCHDERKIRKNGEKTAYVCKIMSTFVFNKM